MDTLAGLNCTKESCEETDDSVILKVEKNDTLGNRGQVTIWKTSLRPLSILEEAKVPEVARKKRKGGC